jgi:fumarate reductase subunit D
MQGARTFRNEAYIQYVGMTKGEVQRRRWCLYGDQELLSFLTTPVLLLTIILICPFSKIGSVNIGEVEVLLIDNT